MSTYELIRDTLQSLNIPVSINENVDKNAVSFIIIIPLYDGFDVFPYMIG